MLRLIRIALQLVIFLLLLGVVIGVAGDTGAIEKVVLVAVGGLLIIATDPVRRIGRSRSAST
jgi:hypothetical protein